MNRSESCFIRQFDHFTHLSEKDKELLRALENEPVSVSRDVTLWETEDKAGQFGILSQGWAYSSRYLRDGTRQILDIYLPGDVIGLGEFAFQRRLNTVIMLEPGQVCFFPHENLRRVFRESETLPSIFFAIASHNQALLTERLINMAKRDARQKLAHFLYETLLRLKRANPSVEGRIELPLSQQLIGEILGLSTVHVSRTFALLREQGLVLRNRQWIDIPDPEALGREADFDGKYLDEDLAHFP